MKEQTILIVDDVRVNQRIIEHFLKPLGECRLAFASNGREAIIQFIKESVSLILMDMEMPVIDGYKATQAIRKLGNGATIPIIAMTAHTGEAEIAKCKASGCTAHLPKPVTKEDLLKMVRQNLASVA